jgi:TusA-related sulfurtransferase
MKKVILLICTLFIFAACSTSQEAKNLEAKAADNIYYTQFTIKHEGGVYKTVNYRKGVVIPINTKVKVLKVGDDSIELKILSTGEEIEVVNTKKFTQADIKEIFHRLLSHKPVDLSKYDKDTIAHIKSGRPKLGMDKKTVLLTLGYPPKHQTPSLDLNSWMYWQNRFNRYKLTFDTNGKLIEVLD